MAICGFNEKIGSGLSLLIAGMIDALKEKAVLSTPRDVLVNELVELDNIISVLKEAEGEVLPEMFVGLNLFAKALFVEVQHDIGAPKRENLENACREIGDRFIDLLARTEIQSKLIRSQQKGRTALAERARELAEWALERSREEVSPSWLNQ